MNSLSTTIQPSSHICLWSFILNMFGVFKPSEHRTTIFPLYTSKKKVCLTFQPISLLPASKIKCLSLQPLSSLFQLLSLLQTSLLSKSPILVGVFDDIHLIYGIYLTQKFLAHYHLKMFHQIVVLYKRLHLVLYQLVRGKMNAWREWNKLYRSLHVQGDN